MNDDDLAELVFERLGIQFPGDPRPMFSDDPTPAEIAAATAEIRAEWSTSKRRERMAKWTIPEVRATGQ